MNFMAIEVRNGEQPHDVIAEFMREAHHRRLSFKRLEVLRILPFGAKRYVHAKTDCPGLLRIVKTFQAGDGRSVRAMIVPTPQGGYQAYLPGGRTGMVPHSTMAAIATTQRVYRGPAVEFWERQFA